MIYLGIVFITVFLVTTFVFILFLRTSVKRFDKLAEKEGQAPLMIAHFTSASKPIQYAFAIGMPSKYANRMAASLHINIDALNRYKTQSDVIKARLVIFSVLALILSAALHALLGFILNR